MTDLSKLKELAQPLIKYIAENHNPHCSVIVNLGFISLVEDVARIPLEKAVTPEDNRL